MTNRIFRAIFLVAAAVMLAVSLLTMGMMYQFSAEETTEKLQRETEYIACGIETDGVSVSGENQGRRNENHLG